MTVYKRGSSWIVDVQIQGHRLHRKAGDTRREALEFQETLKRNARQKKLRKRTALLFSEAASQYLEYTKATGHPRTYEMYHTDYWKHLHKVFQYYFIQDITTDALKAFQAKQSIKGYAPCTVNIHISLIRKIIKFSGVENNIKYPMLKEPRKLHAFLSPEEAGAIINLTRADYVKSPLSPQSRVQIELSLARIRFGILTGLRPAELSHLAWADINSSMKVLTIRSKPLHGWQIKTGEERTVNLSADALGLLKTISRSGPWVFSMGDKPILSIKRSIQTAATLAGVEKHVTPNMLRHTFATLSLAAGASSRAVQALMGHKSIETTERYIDALESSKIKAVDLIGKSLKLKKKEKVPTHSPQSPHLDSQIK